MEGEEEIFGKSGRDREWVTEAGDRNPIYTTRASRSLPNNCTDALNMRPRFSISVKRCRGKRRGEQGEDVI